MSKRDSNLVVPFLDASRSFACGVEWGILFSRLRSGADVVEDYYLLRNESQILLTASRLRWHVAELRYPKEYPGWFWCRLEKR